MNTYPLSTDNIVVRTGLGYPRVIQLLQNKVIRSTKFGKSYAINAKDFAEYEARRARGEFRRGPKKCP